ncbi:MAG: lysophospholipid acyltransferase family protein [bacterium]|nr:lysophospholipid acyltransferase family protein [Candidatus Colousia faecequi]
MMLYFLARYIIRYRRRVVQSNLRRAFPDANSKTLDRYERDFYHHFVDLLKESLLMGIVTRRQMKRIFRFENVELTERIAREKGNFICVFGHQCDWELSASIPLWADVYDTSALYKALHNKFFNRVFCRIRGRFGISLIRHHDAARKVLMAEHSGGKPIMFVFITDQSPKSTKNCDWVSFLGIDSPAIGGWASLAVKTGMPVVYLHIRKEGWLRYSASFEEIRERDRQEMLQKYYTLLEEDIRKQPGQYLWSHKRWKFSR